MRTVPVHPAGGAITLRKPSNYDHSEASLVQDKFSDFFFFYQNLDPQSRQNNLSNNVQTTELYLDSNSEDIYDI